MEISGTYIKVKEVNQNNHGDKFCFGYNDDGRFNVCVFSKDNDKDEKYKIGENFAKDESHGQYHIDINGLLNLDNYTMCNHLFPDPNMNVCFVNDHNNDDYDLLYVALFYTYT